MNNDIYVTDSVGLPTLNDILDELAKPGRDPREKFEAFSFADGIEKIASSPLNVPSIKANITTQEIVDIVREGRER